jgi:hypothetical protein
MNILAVSLILQQPSFHEQRAWYPLDGLLWVSDSSGVGRKHCSCQESNPTLQPVASHSKHKIIQTHAGRF